MRHKQHQQKNSWGIIGGIGLVVVAVVLGALTFRPRHSLAPTTNTDPSSITMTTSDGLSLAATLKMPSGSTAAPAVILLHEYGKDRHEWDAQLDAWVQAGFIVLSYDMRGFGESRLPSIPVSQDDHLRSLVLDVPTAIAYLKTLPRTDNARISIVGVGVGGDVAWQVAGSALGIHRVAVLAPQGATVLDGSTVKDFTPTHVFVLPLSTQVTSWQQRLVAYTAATDVTIAALPVNTTASTALSDTATEESIRSWITK